ncbi:MAG: glycosyltransferase family 39 protein [Patescibacteria group bacterium]
MVNIKRFALNFSPVLQWSLVLFMVFISFIMMLNSSLQESATMDELAHIPSGYGYVKYLDYRLNPEHPPLVKALAAFPLLFQDLNFPTDRSPWQSEINGQWAAGAQFLYESGNDADTIVQWSRIGPMILTLILIIFIYIWSKELIGRWWALLPVFLFSLSPTVLAHGHYVTTDLGAAFGIFIATYYFVKFLFEQSRKNLIFAGLAFGLAQLLKFSAVLLIPFFIFLIAAFYVWKTKSEWHQTAPLAKLKRFSARFLRYLKSLILVFIIGYGLVYAVYFVFTINYPIEKQASDTEFILSSFAGNPDSSLETCKLNSKIAPARRIRCLAEVNILMSQNKILRPMAEYMLGVLMVMQRSSGGNTGYFMGEVSASGWWYYFPVIFALKEPIPSLALMSLAFIIAFLNIVKNFRFPTSIVKKFFDYLGTNFAEFSMISFVIFYWAYSIKSPLNIGIRHILPTLPFIYILTAGVMKKWISSGSNVIKRELWGKLTSLTSALIKISLKSAVIIILIIWYLGETLINSPYFLSYFNQFGGGTNNGYQYAVDSNYDWGQDLKRLKKFTDENNVSKIAIDYFGGGNPQYYLGNKAEGWWSSRGNPKYESIKWIAVSINSIQGAMGNLHPGHIRKPEDEYKWIKNPYQPYAKAGTSIFIYKLE